MVFFSNIEGEHGDDVVENLVEELGFHVDSPVIMHTNNQAAI